MILRAVLRILVDRHSRSDSEFKNYSLTTITSCFSIPVLLSSGRNSFPEPTA
jgi:hypothetical protein